MKKIKYNRSKTYLLPLLSEILDLEPKYHKYIRNTYIFDNLDKYENCIIVQYEFPKHISDFTRYEDKLMKNKYFIELFDDNNLSYIVILFPNEYMKEYNFYKEGKYSQFTNKAKETILSYLALSLRKSNSTIKFLLKVKDILYKNPKLRERIEDELNVSIPKDAELSDIPNKEEEKLDLSLILTEA